MNLKKGCLKHLSTTQLISQPQKKVRRQRVVVVLHAELGVSGSVVWGLESPQALLQKAIIEGNPGGIIGREGESVERTTARGGCLLA